MADPQRPRDDTLPHDQRRARRPASERRFTRRGDGVLGGVAGGIADYVDAPAATVRWIVAIATILSLGIGALIYALLWLLLPRSGGAADPH